MRLKPRTIAITVAAFLLLTALPLIIQGYIPEEVYTYLSKAAGVDLKATLNEIAILGLLITTTLILPNLWERNTIQGLVASTSTRIIWLTITAYTLSLGDLSHLGTAIVSSGTKTTYNMVAIDLRLFIGLAAVITALKIAYSVIEYNMLKPRQPQEPTTDPS